VVTQPLVDSDIAIGKEAFLALRDDAILKPRAAMWYLDEEANEWRFLIATEYAKTRGPQAAYLRVHRVLQKAGVLAQLPVHRIVVTTPDDRIPAIVGRFIGTEGSGPVGLKLLDNTFDRTFLPGLYVYHLQ
jgi:hypothetical protein